MTIPPLDALAAFAREHGVRLLLQFGSTVTGREHARSDLDLAVNLSRVPGSFAELGAIQGALQHLFAGREVDLAVINHADPLFLDRILRDCRLLHGDPRRLAELRIYAFTRYQDHRRFLALERQYRGARPRAGGDVVIDRELVTRKMLLVARDLEPLGALASRDAVAFIAARTDQVLAERYLERIIGRIIDINFHLITESGAAPPSDYHASFLELARLGVLDAAFARQLAPSAGLRNRLVHEYRPDRPREAARRVSCRDEGRAGVSAARRGVAGRSWGSAELSVDRG